MFADVSLAHRIERAEAALSRGLGRAARRPAILQDVGGGVSTVLAGAPTNKIIGVGWEPIDAAPLDQVEATWRELGEPVRVEIATLADPSVLAVFAGRGYALAGFENVLGLRIGDAGAEIGALPDGVTVEAVAAGDADAGAAWGHAVVQGFGHPDGTGQGGEDHDLSALEAMMADFARATTLRRYLARHRGEPAGGASMGVEDGVAQLCGAATIPSMRRRGVQRGLLVARLAEARRAGCDVAVITTAPGSQSQANAQRGGFALLYARAVLIKTWS